MHIKKTDGHIFYNKSNNNYQIWGFVKAIKKEREDLDWYSIFLMKSNCYVSATLGFI